MKEIAGGQSRSEAKREILEKILSADRAAYLLLDARQFGVDVPEAYRDRPNLQVVLINEFAPELSTAGIVVKLNFADDEWYRCRLPWRAVCAIHDNARVHTWGEDAPPEVREAALASVRAQRA